MASVDGTGGGSNSNHETPPTANPWCGGETVEAAATSGLGEDGEWTLCTTVAPTWIYWSSVQKVIKHAVRRESRGRWCCTPTVGSRGVEAPQVLHHAAWGVEGGDATTTMGE
jgi:hypothetical protein